MRPIQMVDLQSQYHRIQKEINAAIAEVVASATFIGGEKVKSFENRLAAYYQSDYVISCGNGTDALQIALMGLGLEPGDEVITPSFTYIATAEVVALLGLKPVLVDVDQQTFCMDPLKVKEAITPKTKVIIPVHLYGQAAPMNEIMKIAHENNLYVVEDNAQATGGSYIDSDGSSHKTGSMGDVGCTSFFPSKPLGGFGDGGAMVTNNAALGQRLRMIANHGQVNRYEHQIVGCNSRLDAIQAAILSVKLSHLDDYIAARTEAADYYDAGLKGNEHITIPYRAPYARHAFYQYTLLLNGVNRDQLMQYLDEKGIPSRVYYPQPVHRQKMFEKWNDQSKKFPVTDWLTDRILSLPMHTELEKIQQDYIIENILNFIKKI